MFQTLSDVKGLLEMAGLRPRKRFGQHFLIDRNLMHKLVDAAEIDAEDAVVEVGVGTGSLTAMLAERAGQVIALEIDRRIAEIARRRLEGLPNVRLIVSDALESKSRLSRSLVAALADASHTG